MPNEISRTSPLILLRMPDVLARTGKARATIYIDIQRGLFPPPISIGKKASAWPDYEIEAINAARVGGSSDDELRLLVDKLMEAREHARSMLGRKTGE